MRSTPAQAQPGFTLIELLMSITIVLLLAVQAVPGVMQAREAARRTQCKNNLKQIGLGLHNYHDVYNSFPPGFVVRDWDSTNQEGTGWLASLLPYIDQAPLYNLLTYNGGMVEQSRNARAKKALTTNIPSMHCPSDTTPDFNAFRGNWPTSNYSGNAGHLAFPRLASGTVTDFWPGQLAPTRTNTGLFGVNSKIGIRYITDGTSNTILASERGASSLAGIWPGVTASSHENDAITETSYLSRPNSSWTAFSSGHDDGLHILLGDGSVRWITDAIDSQPNSNRGKPLGVYQRLGCRDDGQVVGEF